MIKAVFFDIDGTLVSYDTHRIPPSSKEAIIQLRKKGIKVFIATGRPFAAVNNLEDCEFDGFITVNGAYCMTAGKELIFKQPIPSAEVRSFLHYQQTCGEFPCMVATESDIFINQVNQDAEDVFTLINFPFPKRKKLEELVDREIFQLVAFFKENQEKEIMKNVLPGCDAARWNPLFADIVSKGISKQVGIDKVLEYYGIGLGEAMAFGDGGNDLQMLGHVPASVAMGNAADEVKEVAAYVTDTVDNDGIWKALRHFSIIE
ncbi:MAG: hydrolase [Bacteroidales bacterium 45-6]|nr:MAG: hydrolase [Bacteroidales bacterium 45-6]